MVMITRLHAIGRPLGRRWYRAATPSSAGPQALKLIEDIKDRFSQLDLRGRSARDGAPRRAEIVNAQLCDDVIEYLAPTLEPYKGCTIVDVNPGVCLWSEKLHDFLKPTRHILMEPDKNYLEGYVQPLLDRPNSTYRHTTMPGAHSRAYWNNYNELFTDGALMPPRPPLAVDDPKLHEVDYSLLVTGNLARKPSDRMIINSVGYAQLILQHMTWAGLSKQLAHTRGRVRMLWWAPEAAKTVIMPANLALATSLEQAVNFGAKVDEVVGMTPRGSTMHGKLGFILPEQTSPAILQHDLEVVSAKMKAKGMQIPVGRDALSPIPTIPDDSTAFRSPYEIRYSTLEALVEAVEAWEDRWNRRPKSSYGVDRLKKWEAVIYPLIFPQAETLIRGAAATYKGEVMIIREASRGRAIMYIDMMLNAINLEVNFRKLEKDGHIPADEAVELRKRIVGFSQLLAENCYWDGWDKIVLEQLARFQTPAKGAHQNRSFQTLKAEKRDIFPECELTLLDMMPRDTDLTIPDLAGRIEAVKVAQDLLKHLYSHKTDSIVAAIDRLAPNAAQDLIPEMPSVSDPLRGGRLDPNFLPIRLMTEEMYEQFIRAWFEWPFKPTEGQLALSLESGGGGGAKFESITPEGVTGFIQD